MLGIFNLGLQRMQSISSCSSYQDSFCLYQLLPLERLQMQPLLYKLKMKVPHGIINLVQRRDLRAHVKVWTSTERATHTPWWHRIIKPFKSISNLSCGKHVKVHVSKVHVSNQIKMLPPLHWTLIVSSRDLSLWNVPPIEFTANLHLQFDISSSSPINPVIDSLHWFSKVSPGWNAVVLSDVNLRLYIWIYWVHGAVGGHVGLGSSAFGCTEGTSHLCRQQLFAHPKFQAYY